MGISLWAMNNYVSDEEHPYNLFSDITLTPLLSKDSLLNYLFSLYEMDEVQQQNVNILKREITAWFTANYENFHRMAEVLLADYDPLMNYDRTEETVETRDTGVEYSENTSDNSEAETASSGSASGSSQSTGSDTIGGFNEEHTVSAMNASTYQPSSKDTTSNRTDSSTNSSSDSETTSTSGTASESKTGSKAGDSTTDDNFERNSHIFGNIGVMTSQQMAQQTLDLYKFNLYEYISAQFAIKFLFEVW